jgi:hypothetical protein
LLPEGVEGTGEARHHRSVQAAYVYPQFQGIGGHYPLYGSVPKPPLDFTPFIGEQASAVGFHPYAPVIGKDISQILIYIGSGYFGLDSGVGEEYGFDSSFEKGQHPAPAFGHYRAAYTLDRVHQGWIIENDPFFPPGRTILVNQGNFATYQSFREFLGIGNGG